MTPILGSSLRLPLALCALSPWVVGCCTACKPLQTLINGLCCNLCPPGTFLETFCSENGQTVCGPCGPGYFSDQHNLFDRCEKCQLCPEYQRPCTNSSNAHCSLKPSPDREQHRFTDGLTDDAFTSKSVCRDDEFYDVKMKTCKPLTNCIQLGLKERRPGNLTHDSICQEAVVPTAVVDFTVTVDQLWSSEPASEPPGFTATIPREDFSHLFLPVVSVLLSIVLLVFLLSCTYLLRNFKANKSHRGDPEVSADASDVHLSKEESGLQLIAQAESNHSKS